MTIIMTQTIILSLKTPSTPIIPKTSDTNTIGKGTAKMALFTKKIDSYTTECGVKKAFQYQKSRTKGNGRGRKFFWRIKMKMKMMRRK